MNSNNIILIKKSTDELVQNHICNECGVERVVDDEDNICQTCYHKCTDENKCGECTYCARTKVCEYCGCVGGCDSSCRGDEEEATICWDGETCKPDEFGCCVVCCECKACICNLQKAEEEEEEE